MNIENRKTGSLELEELSGRVIGCAINVHRELGPGFLESIYDNALRIELRHAGIPFRFQEEVPVMYRGETAGLHRFDLVVDEQLVIELKAVKALEDIHFAQVRSYLKALNLKHGLLFNFASTPLTVKRVIYRDVESVARA
jgi:GxxExxY protein